MSKKSRWVYVEASYCQVGLMVCQVCRNPIDAGQYRFSEGKNACQHRACSDHDPKWRAIDAAIEAQRKQVVEEIAACKAHKARWNTNGLDDDIKSLEQWLDVNAHLFPATDNALSNCPAQKESP